MFKLPERGIRRALSSVSKQLVHLFQSEPESAVLPRLEKTPWTYRQWAFFHAAKYAMGAKLTDEALAQLVRSSDDFRDFLLALAIATDAESRKAMFLSPETFRQLLTTIVEVVLEHAPSEFRSDNWLGARLSIGAESFQKLHSPS